MKGLTLLDEDSNIRNDCGMFRITECLGGLDRNFTREGVDELQTQKNRRTQKNRVHIHNGPIKDYIGNEFIKF